MSLEVGTRLGIFEILALLGKGGMGEVYRARDTKLERDVAVKLLPVDVAEAKRLARFKREATFLASLSHPHIAAIHGLEESESGPFLVLELVEGEDLAQRLRRGAIPMGEAIDHARQIADALLAAHEKGIVHRDLKPANVMLTADGGIKVLDFGLAKALADDSGEAAAGLSAVPTVSGEGTQPGVVLGTVAYMSPEQARGLPVDRRTDIWAFGALLFEMLTGARAFGGETTSDVLAAVVTRDPDWTLLPSETPASVRRLLRRCLAKRGNERLRDMGDARLEITPDALTAGGSDGSSSGAAVSRTERWLPWVVVAGLVAALVASVLLPTEPPPATRSPVRLSANLFPRPAEIPAPVFALSVDGTRLVYVADVGQQTQLYIRDLDDLESMPIAATEGATAPFLSPDASEVGFFQGDWLRKVSLEDGIAVTLDEQPSRERVRGAESGAWAPDGSIVYSWGRGPLMSVPVSGGQPAALTALDTERGEIAHLMPQVIARAGRVLFTSSTRVADLENATLEVVSLDGGERTRVREGAYFGRYAESGHLLYIAKGSLHAAPFDIERLRETGSSRPVLAGVFTDPAAGTTHLDFSSTGTLVFAAGSNRVTRASGVSVSRSGELTGVLEEPREYYSPRFSPDGRQLSMHVGGGFYSQTSRSDIWVYELDTGAMRQVTWHAAPDFMPIWSPDGERLTFSTERFNGIPNLAWKRADGEGEVTPLIDSRLPQYACSWTPDGRTLVFIQSTESGYDIHALPFDADGNPGAPRALIASEFTEWRPEVSPDGVWLSYSQSDSLGRTQVYVQPLAGGRKIQVSGGDGDYANILSRWSRAADEIYYRDGDQILVVRYSVRNDEFRPEPPELLFEGTFEARGWPDWDVAPDGEAFALFQVEDADGTTPSWDVHFDDVVFVFDWFEELRRRVPATR